MARKDHKSALGCCVCGTKSSSSHFTQTERYALHLPACFRLSPDTSLRPDICNPCVLYVKRYTKASPADRAKWDKSAVVDSKCGPSSKSVFKTPEPLSEEALLARRKRKQHSLLFPVTPRLTLQPHALPPARSLVPAFARTARVERPYTRSRRPASEEGTLVARRRARNRRCCLPPSRYVYPDPSTASTSAVLALAAAVPVLYMQHDYSMPLGLLGLPPHHFPTDVPSSEADELDDYWPPVELPDGRLLYIGQWSGYVRIDEPLCKKRRGSTSSSGDSMTTPDSGVDPDESSNSGSNSTSCDSPTSDIV